MGPFGFFKFLAKWIFVGLMILTLAQIPIAGESTADRFARAYDSFWKTSVGKKIEQPIEKSQGYAEKRYEDLKDAIHSKSSSLKKWVNEKRGQGQTAIDENPKESISNKNQDELREIIQETKAKRD